jgi:hypothetical protein
VSPDVRYALHGVTVVSAIALPGVRRSRRRHRAAIVVSLEPSRGAHRRPIDAFHHWRLAGTRGRPWLSIGRHQGDYVLRFPDLADFDVSSNGDRIVCRPLPRLAETTLHHLLLDQVLPLALSRLGHLTLHASAAHIPRVGCAAFAGSTGSGKSTLAAALGLLGCPVVTDDCLVVGAVHAAEHAVPGYPGLRLWRTATRGLGLERDVTGTVAHYTAKQRLHGAIRFRVRPSPIAVLFVLGRRRPKGLPTRSRTLGSRDRLMALAPYTYVMDVEDRRQLHHMFRCLSSLVTHVPVVRLSLPDSRQRVLEAAGDVLELARTLAARQNGGAPSGGRVAGGS